jgi:threonine dehydrogenase-like Zn-dependent dehydrogenase
MKAALFYGPADIRIEEIPTPHPDENGMLLKVKDCGICPLLDIPRYKRKLVDHAVGIAFGHEFAGEVAEVGSRVKDVKVGDRISGMSFKSCGRCKPCQEGNYGLCLNFTESIAGTWTNGGFAEYILFPVATKDNIIKLPDEMSYRDASLIEPVQVAVGLASKAQPDETAVIIGQELMGLATLAQMKLKGVKKIIVSDLSAVRLNKSAELGADVVVNEEKVNLFEVVMKETQGRGADVVIETAGRPAAFFQSIDIIKEHGSIWLGSFYDEPFMFDPSYQRPEKPHSNITQKHGISIHCPWLTFGSRTQRRIDSMNLIESGKINAKQHVSHVFPLSQTKAAFEKSLDIIESVKVIVEP